MINDNENDIYNYTAPDSPSIDNSFNANTLPSSPDVADSAPNVCQSESFNQPQSNSAWQAPQANFEQPPTPPRMTQVNIRCPQCGTFCSTDFCTECGCDMRANFGAALRNEPPTSSVNGYTVASQYTNPYA